MWHLGPPRWSPAQILPCSVRSRILHKHARWFRCRYFPDLTLKSKSFLRFHPAPISKYSSTLVPAWPSFNGSLSFFLLCANSLNIYISSQLKSKLLFQASTFPHENNFLFIPNDHFPWLTPIYQHALNPSPLSSPLFMPLMACAFPILSCVFSVGIFTS